MSSNLKLTDLRRIVRDSIQNPKDLAFDTIPDANYAKHRAMEAIRNDDFMLAIMLLAMTIALTIQPRVKVTKKKAKKKSKAKTKPKTKTKTMTQEEYIKERNKNKPDPKDKAQPDPTSDRPAGSKGKNDK